MADIAICTIDGCGKPACNGRGWCWGHYKRERTYGDPLGRGIGTPHGEPLAWIIDHANYAGSDCLKWPYTTTPQGRGSLWFRKRMTQAARVMCIIAHGAPPSPQHETAHSCGKGHEGCVNPKHLRWATHSENQMDRVAHGTTIRGSRHPLAKLTESDVREIRRLLMTTSRKEVAAMFGVNRMTITLIDQGKNWAWLA